MQGTYKTVHQLFPITRYKINNINGIKKIHLTLHNSEANNKSQRFIKISNMISLITIITNSKKPEFGLINQNLIF